MDGKKNTTAPAEILNKAAAAGAPDHHIYKARKAVVGFAGQGIKLPRRAVDAMLAELAEDGVGDSELRTLRDAMGHAPQRRKRKTKTAAPPPAVPGAAGPAAPAPAAAPAPVPLHWRPPADSLPIPRHHLELCDSEEAAALMVERRAAGRLRRVAESGEWLFFSDTRGWLPVATDAIEEALADAARWNIGKADEEGGVTLIPSTWGRRHVGHAVAGLLGPRSTVTSAAADWDADRSVIALPGGDLLDVFTGIRRRPSINDLHRRRVRVEPADSATFGRSLFAAVVQHAIPDPAERLYVQRRLGAALVDAAGLDDVLWLFGPPGSGKGTIVRAIKETVGTYAGGVPTDELIQGAHKGHSAWLARLDGCRYLIADDVPTGVRLNDATINRLLGSEITAQHMRHAPFDFRLQAPLICTSNGPPRLTSMNVRRLRPVQCGGSVPDPDPQVRAAMATELEIAACLRWLLDGAADWKVHGCPVPESILTRARETAASAPIAEFTAQFQNGERLQRQELYARWQVYCRDIGEEPGTPDRFSGLLDGAGWGFSKSNGIRYRVAPTGSRRVAPLIDSHDARVRIMKDNNQRDPTRPLPPDFPMNIGDVDSAQPSGDPKR